MQTIFGKLIKIEQSKLMEDRTTFILGNLKPNGSTDHTRIAGQLNNPTVGDLLQLSGNYQDHPRHGHLFRFFKSGAKPVQQAIPGAAKKNDAHESADNGLTLEGELKKIRFEKETGENLSWVVATLKIPSEKEEILIVGEMIKPTVGDNLKLTGEWKNHPQFGRQFAFQACFVIPPDTEEGILAALASGRVKGIGPKLAKRIVDQFGKDTFRVIEEDPDQLLEISKLGPKKGQKDRRELQGTTSRHENPCVPSRVRDLFRVCRKDLPSVRRRCCCRGQGQPLQAGRRHPHGRFSRSG